MGKAVPRLIKTKSMELIEAMPDAFSEDFTNNKKAIAELKMPFSKKQVSLMTWMNLKKLTHVV